MSKISTPIADFVQNYAQSNTSRLHMPAHKGNSLLGCESLDITEILGADVLYSANGIIDESENNATELFGTAHSFYSTEGSTLSIKAMLAIIKKISPKDSYILAARNVHKAFIYACGLLDIDVEWIFSENAEHFCDCTVDPNRLKDMLKSAKKLPCAVYITSPSYLGKIQDIAGISKVCKEFGVYLLVDNAHGAYLAFEEPSNHPIALGADICCDSAHKTLPTLTGGAYLHISKNFLPYDKNEVRASLSLFASTSPSYLIMQSLDLTNAYLTNGFKEKLLQAKNRVKKLKSDLASLGFICEGDEPLKIVITSKKNKCSCEHLAKHLRNCKIEPEYAECDALVLMISTENTDVDFERIKTAFKTFYPDSAFEYQEPTVSKPKKASSIREALFSKSERIATKDSKGRICATPSVSCPPAVTPIVSGEIIDDDTVNILLYYGIEEIEVIKN